MRFEMKDGDTVIVKASPHAVAFVTNPTNDLTCLWAERLTKLLNWNSRPSQKSFKKPEEANDNH